MIRLFLLLTITCSIPLTGTATGDLLQKNNAQSVFEQQFLKFTSNGGQWDDRIVYRSYSPGWGANVNFLKNGLSFGHKKHVIEGKDTTVNLLVWNILFKNSNPDIKISEKNTSEKNINYFIGHKKTHAYTASTISYNNVYRNIDARYYYSQNYLKYDYVVKPGGNINSIQMTCEGIQDLKLNDRGDLEITTSFGTCVEQKPYTYQLVEGKVTEVKSHFILYDKNTFGFAVDDTYNKKFDLIIDPVQIKWSTYVSGDHGGISNGEGHYLSDIAIDAQGDIYATGTYDDTNFPVQAGAYDMGANGLMDVVVYKMNSSGTNLLYCTYFGGSQDDIPWAIDIDPSGNAYICGETFSSDMATTLNAWNTSYGSKSKGFLLKFDPTGSSLLYSTLIGRSTGVAIWGTRAIDIAVEQSTGNAYITGLTFNTDFPTSPGAYDATHSITGFKYDAFFCKISPLGNGVADMLYSTYLGGLGTDVGCNIAVNSKGWAVITGDTESNDFFAVTVPNSYDNTWNGAADIFVAIIDPQGNGLADLKYSTFVGGTDYEESGYNWSAPSRCHSMVLNAQDEIFATGRTQSTNFPVYPAGVVDGTNLPASVAMFVFRLNPVLTGPNDMVFTTCIGGNYSGAQDVGYSLALNDKNDIFILGTTNDPTSLNPTACASLNLSTFTFTPPYNGIPLPPGYCVVAKLSSDGKKFDFLGINNFGDMIGKWGTGRIVIDPLSCGTYDLIISGNFKFGTYTQSGKTGIFGYPFVTTAGSFQPDLKDTLLFSGGNAYGARSGTLTKLTQKLPVDFAADTVCVGLSTTLVNTTDECGLWDSVKTWHWDFGDGTNTTDRTPAPHVFPGPGIYNVKLIASCPYDSITKQVEVLVGGAYAGTDTSICVGQSITITAAPGANTYNWSPSTGLSCNTCQIVTANPTTTTTYTLTTTSFVGYSCPATDTITISITPGPSGSISSNGPDTICAGLTLNLTGAGASNYEWSTGETSTSISVTPTSTTTYSVIIFDSPACMDTVFKIIKVDPTLVVDILGDTAICEGESTVLSANAFGATDYSWSTGETSNGITVNPTSASTYSVTASNTNCSGTAQVIVTISSPPVADAGPDDSVCYGNSLTLTGTGGGSYSWSNGSSTSITVVTPLINTVYTLTVSNGCDDIDAVEIIVNPLPIVNAGDNVYILEGESVTLSATAGGGTVQWSPPTGLSCTDCIDPVATPKVTTTYYVTTTDAKGCSSTDTITVFVEMICRDLYVPNAFSPNEDGQNDVFYIEGNCLSELSFSIFDRWGLKVFLTDNIEEGWDGKYKGKELDSGVFFYTLFAVTTTGKEISLTGNIHLVR